MLSQLARDVRYRITIARGETRLNGSDWIIMVVNGLVVEMGTHNDLIRHEAVVDADGVVQHGFYNHLWTSQR